MKTAKLRIFDGHNDTLTAIKGQEGITGFLQGGSRLHIDLAKARSGNMAGGCFAVFIDAPDKGRPLSHGYASIEAEKCIDLLEELQKRSEGEFCLCRNSADIANVISRDSVAAILHFEGAEPISADLSDLECWYGKGLRSVGLTWSRANAFGLGVGFGFGQSSDNGPGLTYAGFELVRQCQEMGIMVDLAHLNAAGISDVLRISQKPVVISHGCVWNLSHSPRNYTDDQIRAVADTGGLIGVNFHVGFLRVDGKDESDTPLELISRHIEYIADLAGIEHVALGSDFDGATMPDDLKDAAGFPRIIRELQQSCFTTSEIEKIALGNWQRVIRDNID